MRPKELHGHHFFSSDASAKMSSVVGGRIFFNLLPRWTLQGFCRLLDGREVECVFLRTCGQDEPVL